MSGLIEINGALINGAYLYPIIAWYISTIAFWPFVVVGVRRAWLTYQNSNRKLKDYLVYWTHISLTTFFLTVVAVDPAAVYFDTSGLINLICMLELTILNYSSAIYTFVGTVQHYMVQATLTAPPWVAKFRTAFLIFNLVVGNIALIVQVAVDRANLSGLTVIFLASEGLVFGPVFLWLVLSLTKRLREQFSSTDSICSVPNDNREKILKGVRRFRIFAYTTTALMYVWAAMIYAVYIPRLFISNDVAHSNSPAFPDFARHRMFRETFNFNWINWVALISSSYFLWRHWIKKSSFAGKLSQKNTSKQTKSISNSDSPLRRVSTASDGPKRVSTNSSWAGGDANSVESRRQSEPDSRMSNQSSIWGPPRRGSQPRPPSYPRPSPRNGGFLPRSAPQTPLHMDQQKRRSAPFPFSAHPQPQPTPDNGGFNNNAPQQEIQLQPLDSNGFASNNNQMYQEQYLQPQPQQSQQPKADPRELRAASLHAVSRAQPPVKPLPNVPPKASTAPPVQQDYPAAAAAAAVRMETQVPNRNPYGTFPSRAAPAALNDAEWSVPDNYSSNRV